MTFVCKRGVFGWVLQAAVLSVVLGISLWTVGCTGSALATKATPSSPATTTQGSGTAGVTSMMVSPAAASSVASGILSFTAAVQGTVTDKTVTWKAVLGTITSAGAYTAPAKAGTD